MVVAVSNSFNARTDQTKAARPPSPSFRPESNSAAGNRRPKTRDVASRYLSTSTSSSCSSLSSLSSSSSFRSSSSSTSSTPSTKRSSSPIVSRINRPTTPSTTKRSQSVGRRQSVTPRSDSSDPRANGEVSTAQRMLLTSARSLSVSFQGDLVLRQQTNKCKLTPSPTTGQRETPERRKTTTVATPGSGAVQREKSRPAEQWPRSRQPSSLSRSVDFTDARKRLSGSGNGVVRPQRSLIDNRLVSRGNVPTASASADKERVDSSVVESDSIVSDIESVSSGSTVSGGQERNGRGQRLSAGGVVVPAIFPQLTNNCPRQLQEAGSPVSKPIGLKPMASTKLIVVPRKFSVDSPMSSPRAVVNSRGQLLQMRDQIRPASPSKYATPAASSLLRGTSTSRGISPSRGPSTPRGIGISPSRGTSTPRGISPSRGVSPSRGTSPSRGMSPSRVRNSLSSSFFNAPSILSFTADAKRGKIGENQVADAHLLRLFYNRMLQWRFANARANVVLSVQKMRVERSLYNAWISISKLYDTVRLKRTEMQLLKQNLKLISILDGQMTYLEEWGAVDRDYTSSVVGAVEALRGSTVCLPVICGAMGNVQSIKDAICSAVDVMQAMASSICLLLPKVGKLSCLAADLANVNLKEHNTLEECRELLSSIAALQVTECSFRTQDLQLQHEKPSNYLTSQSAKVNKQIAESTTCS